MDVYKVLKNEIFTISGTPHTVTYQVPPTSSTQVGGGSGPVVSPLAASVNTQTLVTSVFVCNVDAESPADFSLAVSNYDSVSPIVTTLYNDVRIYGGDSAELNLNLTLKSLDEVIFTGTQYSSVTPSIHVTIFGIEMVTGVGPRG
jgi:hypothetical protein|tara:strand:- start:143 stop:577 length:435 start_codon:yes stop_codon:yes gene_type:complete